MKLKTSGNNSLEKLRSVIMGSTDSTVIENFDTVSTGIPSLDKILGGGIILGGVVEIAGLEATGKSTLGAMVATEAQKRSIPVVYLDTEAAMSIARLKSIGVNTDELIYVQPRSLEDVYGLVASIIKSKIVEKAFSGPALIVWDSLAATAATKEIEGDEYDKEMAIRARVNSSALRKLSIPLSENQVTLLVINQYRENIGQMWGDKFSTPGGHSIKYAAIQRIQIRNAGNIDIDKASNIVGKKIDFKTVKNKIHQPLLECTAIFNNNTGNFDIAQSAFEYLKSIKRVFSSGPIWVLNLNEDLSNNENTIKFKRTEFDKVYEENKEKIDKLY